MASARIRLLGGRAVPGDLVLLPPEDLGDASGSALPLEAYSDSCLGRNIDEESGVPALQDTRIGAREQFTAGSVSGERTSDKSVIQVLTRSSIDAFASRGVTAESLLRSVVLPLPGTSMKYPSHEVRLASPFVKRKRLP